MQFVDSRVLGFFAIWKRVPSCVRYSQVRHSVNQPHVGINLHTGIQWKPSYRLGICGAKC